MIPLNTNHLTEYFFFRANPLLLFIYLQSQYTLAQIFIIMTQKYFILLCLAFLTVACNSDQSPSTGENQPISIKNDYEKITNAYLPKQQEKLDKATRGFWNWLKNVATADAKAAASYTVKHGMKSDWKEALLIGAAASVEAALSTKSPKKNSLSSAISSPYSAFVLSDISLIKSAVYPVNFMDDLGYSHYVLVNEVLQDPSLSEIPQSERKGVLYDKTYKQAQKLGINAIYDKQEAIALLTRIENTVDDSSDSYYSQLFPFQENKDLDAYKKISRLYTTTFFKVTNPSVFIAYSKEMEAAVVRDASISQTVKETLLLEMATYRYGTNYYAFNH